jgi:hypothetical protein
MILHSASTSSRRVNRVGSPCITSNSSVAYALGSFPSKFSAYEKSASTPMDRSSSPGRFAAKTMLIPSSGWIRSVMRF